MKSTDLKYLLAYMGPILVFIGVYFGGWLSYSAFIFAFVIVPASELISSGDSSKDPEVEQRRGVHPFFDWLLYFNLPLVYGMVIFYLERLTHTELTTFELVGMTLGVGIFIGASGINVAHELGHRSHKTEIWMSKLLLLPALYQHFYIEHNRGHHKYVATPDDPATARYGETVYHFWIRSTWGGLKNAWKLEAKRLVKLNVGIFTLSNQCLQFFLMQLAYLSLILYFFGWMGLVFAVIVAVIGFLMLESINYIEHYGLCRLQNAQGVYEKVAMQHSWNANQEAGRILLYELTRHADHHYKASKKYQLLQHFEESPQLPTGYPGSIILAMIPPIWFKIMNKRVPHQMVPR